jgi:hypothetical protein
VASQLNAARDLIADAHLSLDNAAPSLEPLPAERSSPAAKDTVSTQDTKEIKNTTWPAGPDDTGPPKEHWEPEIETPARPARR